MAVFKFKYAPVLRQRQIVEDQAQRDLARLLRHQMVLETQLRDMQQTITGDKQVMAGALSQQVDVSQVRRQGAYVNQVRARAQQIVLELLALQRKIDQARVALQQAMKQRKAMEMLRDKQFDEWREQQKKREAYELDEFATQQFVRREMDGIFS